MAAPKATRRNLTCLAATMKPLCPLQLHIPGGQITYL